MMATPIRRKVRRFIKYLVGASTIGAIIENINSTVIIVGNHLSLKGTDLAVSFGKVKAAVVEIYLDMEKIANV